MTITGNENNENANISVDARKETYQTTGETKEKVDTLKDSTINVRLSNAETRVDINAAQTEFMNNLNLNSLDWYLRACNTLLTEINNAIQATKNTRWLSQAWKKTMQNTRKKLQSYKKWVKGKKNSLIKQHNPEIYPSDREMLKNYRRDLEAAKHDIAQWQRWEFSNKAWYVYNSPETSRRSNLQQERVQQFEQKLQQEVKDGAILNIFNWNIQNATNFYRRIAEGKYTSADYTIYTTYADTLNWSLQRCWIPVPVEQWIFSPATWTRTWRYIDYTNTSRTDTLQQWWLAWAIDKLLSNCNNLTPWQRNTRKTLWVLGWFAAWIFWLVKFYKSKKLNFRWKAWITAAAILWSQILTGEWPLSLFNKLMTWWLSRERLKSTFWNAISWIWGSWIESASTIAPAMYSMMVFNSGTTLWDINTMTQNFKSDNRLRRDFYNESLNKLEWQYWWRQTTEYFRANFSENFDEQKRNAWLASFWVVDTSNPLNSRKLIYELANNATMNEIALEKFKSENWLKETSNKTKKQEFKNYINELKNKNQQINIITLQQHQNDWFEPDVDATYTERPEDKQNKDALVSQVENISLDENKKAELKTAIQTFYDKRTIESKPILSDFSLKYNDGILTVISHKWEKTEINLETREIAWFQVENRFATLDELINAADITNKILLCKKWEIPVKLPAFEYKNTRQWICFNDAKTLSKDFDTRVLSDWRWEWTKKINPIYKHPRDYAAYLSKRRLDENKVETSPTLYPMVDDFSKKTWIIFINKKEVEDLEAWLKQIKEWKKFSIWNIDWKAFKTSWKWFNTKLQFTNVDWTKEFFEEDISEKFPTIMANKDKFLSYMNDKNNWMRWSEITNRMNP